MTLISIVVPAHNEQENIADVVKKIEETIDLPHELLVVNDHSSDATGEILAGLACQYNNIRVIENNLEKGFANAVRTGFKNVNAEFVVPVMADLCDDLETVKKMRDKMNEGYDVVCGCRYTKGGIRSGGSRIKAFFSGFAGISLAYLLDFPSRDITNSFKMYRKKVLDAMKTESAGFEVSMEMCLTAYFSGYKITDIPTVWHERTKGQSNFRICKLLPKYLKLYIWALFMDFSR